MKTGRGGWGGVQGVGPRHCFVFNPLPVYDFARDSWRFPWSVTIGISLLQAPLRGKCGFLHVNVDLNWIVSMAFT